MYLSNGACHSSADLEGRCLAFLATGGCVVCNPGFFRDDSACAACPADCATCLVAEMCLTCNDTHFMTVSWT